MKVGIVGSGMVGSAAGYAMVLEGVVTDIVFIDVNMPLAKAQAEDILHATPVSNPARVSAGDYAALAESRVVILACGASQKPGENRLQLLDRNKRIFDEVTQQVVLHAPDSILLVASNPVDLMTYFVSKHGGLPPARVIGSGTILDTARFRTLLGDFLGISPHSVHAHVLGEHGDSEVLAWSSADVAGIQLEDVALAMGVPITGEMRSSIDRKVRRAAYSIIEGKGATWYGIGAALARVVRAIRDDERAVLTLTNVDTPGFDDISFSLPRVVGAQGIIATLPPSLSATERNLLERSAETLRKARG